MKQMQMLCLQELIAKCPVNNRLNGVQDGNTALRIMAAILEKRLHRAEVLNSVLKEVRKIREL